MVDPQEAWIERFDYLTGNLVHQESLLDIAKIKSFISTLVKAEYERGAKEAKERFIPVELFDLGYAKGRKEALEETAEKIAHMSVDLCENSQEFKAEVLKALTTDNK